MSCDKAVELQHVIRENSSQLQSYLTDLEQWEKEMKKKDEEIKKRRLDGELDKPMSDNRKNAVLNTNSSCKKDRALQLKDAGNKYLKESNFCLAVEKYSEGIQEDPENAVLPANRALANLKLKKFDLAESDCTLSLSLDPSYVKAYLRRGSARIGLKKFKDAESDFRKSLQFEPSNQEAIKALKEIEKETADLNSEDEAKRSTTESVNSRTENKMPLKEAGWVPESRLKDSVPVDPINKPKHLQSKKPLISIEVQSSTAIKSSISPTAIKTSTSPTSIKTSTSPTSIKSSASATSIKSSASPTSIKSSTSPTAVKSSTSPENLPSKSNEGFQIKPSSSKDVEPTLPRVPLKSYQFESDWKKMKDFPALQYKYLKQFPPEKFAVMFRNSMEAELLADIIKVLDEEFIRGEDDIVSYLLNLGQIGRFQTLLMLFSDKEIRNKENLLKFVNASDQVPETQKKKLLTLYNC